MYYIDEYNSNLKIKRLLKKGKGKYAYKLLERERSSPQIYPPSKTRVQKQDRQ